MPHAGRAAAAQRVGWAKRWRPDALPGHRIRAGGRAAEQRNAEPVLLAPQRVLLVDRYAARDFFAAFSRCFAAVFGVAFFAALPFSFAANSCLTLAEMASTSTL